MKLSPQFVAVRFERSCSQTQFSNNFYALFFRSQSEFGKESHDVEKIPNPDDSLNRRDGMTSRLKMDHYSLTGSLTLDHDFGIISKSWQNIIILFARFN
jgi:hypothetical protein